MRVPGWKPPQGAGVAVADLSGDGRPDVMVLAGDRYRVGRSLDTSGAVSGGWGRWLTVPDWRFGEVADAGIAIAGRDLVVFAIEKGAHYRVARGLDAEGAVTGGWTAWKRIPDSSGGGGDIALADLDGDGTPELIVVMAGARRRPLPRRLEARREVGAVDGDPGLAAGGGQRARRRRRRPRRRRAARAAGARPRAPDDRLGTRRRWPRRRGLGAVERSARRPPRPEHGGRVRLPDRRRAAGADDARRRRRRHAARRGRRGSRRGGRLADPRPQLADPGRARRADAHRRRAVVRRLRSRPRRPRRRPLPHPRLALPEPELQLPAHPDRPLLRRPDLPRGRPVAGRRRHRPVHALPRHPRRPGLRPRGPALDPGTAHAQAALVPDAHHARRRPDPLGLGPRRLPRARARPGELRGRRGLAAGCRRPG